MLEVLFIILTALAAMASPLPKPVPTDLSPSVTVVDFAKSAKGATGQRTRVQTPSAGGGDAAGAVVTRTINNTVTTGRFRSSTSKSPSVLKGKIAGIVLGVIVGIVVLIVVAVLVHKWRKRGTGHVCGEDQQPGDLERGDEVLEKKLEDDGADSGESALNGGKTEAVPGQIAYKSESAIPTASEPPSAQPIAQSTGDSSPKPK